VPVGGAGGAGGVLGIGGGLLPKVLSGEKGLLSSDGESGHASRFSQVNEFPSYLQLHDGDCPSEGSPSYRHPCRLLIAITSFGGRLDMSKRVQTERLLSTYQKLNVSGFWAAKSIKQLEMLPAWSEGKGQHTGPLATCELKHANLRSNARDSQVVNDKLTTAKDERL
jgi:hypothetical protein